MLGSRLYGRLNHLLQDSVLVVMYVVSVNTKIPLVTVSDTC